MATLAQIEANRANSRHSTGPRIEEGKARSSSNAKTHGLFASLESFAPTEHERFQRFLDFHTHNWSPAGEQDTRLVLDLALADFRRDRSRALEGAWFADRVEQLRTDDGLPDNLTPAQVTRLEARALQHDCDYSMVLSRLFKWERAFNRDFDRLTAQLRDSSLQRFFENAKTKPISSQPVDNAQPVAHSRAAPGDTAGHSPSGSPQIVTPLAPQTTTGDTEGHPASGFPPIADPRVPTIDHSGQSGASPSPLPPRSTANRTNEANSAPPPRNTEKRLLPLRLRPETQALLRP